MRIAKTIALLLPLAISVAVSATLPWYLVSLNGIVTAYLGWQVLDTLAIVWGERSNH